MATESTAAPAGGTASQGGSQSGPASVNPSTAAAAPANAPQLTGAQAKAKAKAEKAARRAQAKETKAAVVASQPQPGPGGADAKGGKGKGKQDGTQTGSQAPGKSSGLVHRPSMTGRRPSILVVEKDIRGNIPECFSHLPMAKRIPLSHVNKDVHPAVLTVGQQMATFALKDSISRLEATLLAFRKVSWITERVCGV